MSMRIFITGSADGLGLAAARTLMDEGHEVVLHARSRQRASGFADLAPRAAGTVIGDLSSATETRSIAEQVNSSAVWMPSFTTPAFIRCQLAAKRQKGTRRSWR